MFQDQQPGPTYRSHGRGQTPGGYSPMSAGGKGQPQTMKDAYRASISSPPPQSPIQHGVGPAKKERSPRVDRTSVQFAWFVLYLVCVLCVFQSSLDILYFSWGSTRSKVCYRLGLLASISAQVMAVWKMYHNMRKQFRGRNDKMVLPKTAGQALTQLASDPSVHYLAITTLFLFSNRNPFVLATVGVFALYHVVVYTAINVANSMYEDPESQSWVTELRTHKEVSMLYYLGVAVALEILAVIPLVFRVLLLQVNSLFLLAIYVTFLTRKYHTEKKVRLAFKLVGFEVTRLLKKVSPGAQGYWRVVESQAGNYASATRSLFMTSEEKALEVRQVNEGSMARDGASRHRDENDHFRGVSGRVDN